MKLLEKIWKRIKRHKGLLALACVSIVARLASGDDHAMLPLVGGFLGVDIPFISKSPGKGIPFITKDPYPNRHPAAAPAPAAAPSGGGGGGGGGGGYYGGGGGGGYAAAAAAAAAAEAARVAKAQDQARNAWKGAISGSQAAVNTLESTYNDKTNPFLVDLETGVGNVNTSREQNSLNLRRTQAGIADNVRQGLRSGGVNLANINAGDSGAVEALARAWARVGNTQTGSARNDAALKGGEIDTTASTLDQKKRDTLSSLDSFRNVEIDRLGRDIEQKLAQINSDLTAQNVPGIVNVIGDKDTLTGDAFRRLNQIAAARDARVAAAKYLTPDEVLQKAIQMDAAGAAATPFDVAAPNIIAPDGTHMGGAPLSQFPWAVKRRDQVDNPSSPDFNRVFPVTPETAGIAPDVPAVPLVLGG